MKSGVKRQDKMEINGPQEITLANDLIVSYYSLVEELIPILEKHDILILELAIANNNRITNKDLAKRIHFSDDDGERFANEKIVSDQELGILRANIDALRKDIAIKAEEVPINFPFAVKNQSAVMRTEDRINFYDIENFINLGPVNKSFFYLFKTYEELACPQNHLPGDVYGL